MVIVTCRDDNSIGNVIAQSTGDPTAGFYGYPATQRIGPTAPAR